MIYDLKIWFRSEKKKYIPIILLCVYVVFTINITAKSAGMAPNIIDYLFGLFKGEPPYLIKLAQTERTPFTLPPLYLLFNFYLSWLISYYPLREMGNLGRHTILKHGTKQKWWISKCVWATYTVISYYATVLIVFGIALVFSGKSGFVRDITLLKDTINSEKVDYNHLEQLSNTSLAVMCILLPLVVSLGLSMIQMMLSLVIKPIYSQVVIIGVLVCSSFSCKVFLPGNYLMYLRNRQLLFNSGVGTISGLILGICIILFGGFGVLYIIIKKDILL